MASAKLFIAGTILACFSLSVNAGFLDDVIPTVMSEFYKLSTSQEGYRFNLDEKNGNKREEVGMILNPGTDKEQLVVMGAYTVYDEKTDTETITMYTADSDGYKPRFMLKKRKLSASALKSAAG
ncbi:larval cuticle protein 65Ab1-like [Eurosta solidaginis]|uniref:larval cuticle protein 65Ab1-like n=1 Tax=Eurosta solidaginis TaxID=178769 RepID=UPI003530B0F7